MEASKYSREIRKMANSIARKSGYGFATEITIGTEDKIISHISPGYRKCTTGEYVPNSYLNNFGWKNIFYQNSQTHVQLAESLRLKKVIVVSAFEGK